MNHLSIHRLRLTIRLPNPIYLTHLAYPTNLNCPTFTHTCLPACLSAHPPACLPAYLLALLLATLASKASLTRPT